MDERARIEYLRLPPEEVRLALAYPELPQPIPFATAEPFGPADRTSERQFAGLYCVGFELAPDEWDTFWVPKEHHRIVEEYEAAAERLNEAEKTRQRDRERAAETLREPEPEAIPAGGNLTPRQEEFCRHYATQPVAVRAAVLAGYAETSADTYGPRLLRNPLVLDRIARLRDQQQIRYIVERDTVHDKLEAVFFGALAEHNYAAAVASLRLQAALGGLSVRSGGSAAPGAAAGDDRERARAKSGKVGSPAREKSGKVRMKAPKKYGKVRKSR